MDPMSAIGFGTGGIAALGGLGLGLGSTFGGSGLSDYSLSIPRRNLSQEINQSLASRRKFSGATYGQQLSEAVMNPYVTEAGLTSTLLGSAGGPMSYQFNTPRLRNGQWVDNYSTRTIDVPQTRGLLNIMGEDVLPAYDRMQMASQERLAAGNLGLLNAYGGQYQQALQGTQDPAVLALRQELLRQTMGELQAGSRMDPGMQNEFAQYVRGAQAARGMGLGPIDAYQEAATLGTAGQALRQQRQQSAANVYGLMQQTDPSAWQLLLGGGNNMAGAQNLAYGGYGAAAGAQSFDPWNPGGYAQDIYGFNANAGATEAIARYNAQLQDASNRYNSLMGLSGGLMQGGFGLMGAAMGGGGGGGMSGLSAYGSMAGGGV